MASVSAGVDFRWFSSSDAEFPAPFEQIFAGSLKWSLDGIRQHQQSKAGWIEAVFPNPNDPYDSVWHNKLAFQDVGNGDYLSLDLSGAGHGQVVYLSHDDGEGHGHVMAESFADLLAHWVPLACVGGEDWQWIPFTDRLTTPINRECVSARAWRDLLSSKD